MLHEPSFDIASQQSPMTHFSHQMPPRFFIINGHTSPLSYHISSEIAPVISWVGVPSECRR